MLKGKELNLTPITMTYSKTSFNLNKLFKINEKYDKQYMINKIQQEQKLKNQQFINLKRYDENNFYKPIDEMCGSNGNIHNYHDFIKENLDCSYCKRQYRKEKEKLENLKKKTAKTKDNKLNFLEIINLENQEEIKNLKKNKYKEFIEKRNKYFVGLSLKKNITRKIEDVKYNPNFDFIKKKIQSIQFKPLNKKEIEELDMKNQNEKNSTSFKNSLTLQNYQIYNNLITTVSSNYPMNTRNISVNGNANNDFHLEKTTQFKIFPNILKMQKLTINSENSYDGRETQENLNTSYNLSNFNNFLYSSSEKINFNSTSPERSYLVDNSAFKSKKSFNSIGRDYENFLKNLRQHSQRFQTIMLKEMNRKSEFIRKNKKYMSEQIRKKNNRVIKSLESKRNK